MNVLTTVDSVPIIEFSVWLYICVDIYLCKIFLLLPERVVIFFPFAWIKNIYSIYSSRKQRQILICRLFWRSGGKYQLPVLVLKHKHTPKETHELTQLKNEGETSGMTAAASQPQSEGVTGNGEDDWMSGLCFVVDLPQRTQNTRSARWPSKTVNCYRGKESESQTAPACLTQSVIHFSIKPLSLFVSISTSWAQLPVAQRNDDRTSSNSRLAVL